MIENLPGEEWRDIAGYEGLYQISNKGRVLSTVQRHPKIKGVSITNVNYFVVSLYRDKKRKSFLVHRLVMLAFQPIDNPERFEVNHIDFNKQNPCLENLEWTTGLQNMRHFVERGKPRDQTKFTGSNHHLSSLTDTEVMEIRSLCTPGKRNICAVARQYGLHMNTVRHIVYGKTWRHLLPII